MREPKLYGPYPPKAPGCSERYFVRWREEGNVRKGKAFTGGTVARLFYQEKLAEHAGQPFNASMVAL
jgi:hypothetical protein